MVLARLLRTKTRGKGWDEQGSNDRSHPGWTSPWLESHLERVSPSDPITPPNPPLQLDDGEIASIESFRRLKDTSVLTIMFTDIVGFTQLTDERGEHHSNEVRHLHDEVLEGAITEGAAGLVVKHIGDAIMAVFSEPSAAVEAALRIHERLEQLSEERPDLDPLRVKVGLDMGQVTVEESVDTDVFGRHVNRASRVEGLAGGGQVFMTYTVFDSARGWLSTPTNERFEWASHGRYRLKGVSAPVEIFEVADPERGPLRPPKRGDKVRSIPSLAWAAALVLFGVAGTVAYSQFQATELWLAQYGPESSYLDGTTEVRLEGEPGDTERKLLVDIRPGTHVLHYDVADPVRYHAEIELERGENHVRADFAESRLPTLYRYRTLGDEAVEATREATYFLYGTEGERLERTATLAVSVDVGEAPQPGSIVATFGWNLAIDGVAVTADERSLTRPVEAAEQFREEFEVYSDEHHTYSVRLRVVRQTAHLDVLAAFRAPPTN